ncbi:hypothetical protein [Gottfriedia acidiceleris]|uniref:hypothetical protein n=1 Tax=Gottfriedia acidiceleris TaxID=371036 RepID=UPI002FFE7725
MNRIENFYRYVQPEVIVETPDNVDSLDTYDPFIKPLEQYQDYINLIGELNGLIAYVENELKGMKINLLESDVQLLND